MTKRDEQIARDRELLQQQIGYKQELKRSFGALQSFALCFAITGLVPSIASTLPYALASGPAGMIWGWVIGVTFIATITTSLAEMASALPTSGGLYFWTFYYGPPSYRNFLCFFVGYANTLGHITGLISVAYAVAVMISSVVGIATNGAWTVASWQIYLLALGIMVSHATVCSLPGRVLAAMQTVYMVGNVLIVIVVAILLPIMTPAEKRPDATWVFTHFENATSWPPGFTFILALLMPLWTVNSFDATIHISEETRDATRSVPLALLSMTGASFVLGLACVIGISFSINDYDRVRNSPLGQPMAQIFLDAFGHHGALAAWTVVMILTWCMGSGISISASRQVWAFARDGALPFSRIISRVNKHGVPIYSIWFSIVISAIFGLLALVNDITASALFSLGVVSVYTCYAVPVFCRLAFGRAKFVPGPFYTGRLFSPLISWTSIAFEGLFLVIFMFPTKGPMPTHENMNYTVVIYAAMVAGVVIYWNLPVIGAKHWFVGPKNDYAMDSDIQGEVIEGSIVHSSSENNRLSSKACQVLGIHFAQDRKDSA